MISRIPQKISDWLMDSSLVTPKDPDVDDENEGDEEDDDEGDTEPAVIREPDEC
jgi:hypothetical protein